MAIEKRIIRNKNTSNAIYPRTSFDMIDDMPKFVDSGMIWDLGWKTGGLTFGKQIIDTTNFKWKKICLAGSLYLFFSGAIVVGKDFIGQPTVEDGILLTMPDKLVDDTIGIQRGTMSVDGLPGVFAVRTAGDKVTIDTTWGSDVGVQTQHLPDNVTIQVNLFCAVK